MIDRILRLFGRGTPPLPPISPVTLRPIGVVRNGVKEPTPSGWESVESRIVVHLDLEDALLGLDTYSHIIVLFWPHRVPEEVRGSKHRLHPLDDPENPLQGILATRSQIRFNPVCLTAVPLLGIKGNVIRVRGLDAIDGTPVLDLKPYVPHFDSIPEARLPGWVRERVLRCRQGG